MNEFIPNWTTPPGATIKDIMEERGITEDQLSEMLEFDDVKALLEGKVRIGNYLAAKLEEKLGSSKSFWLKRQLDHTLDKLRLSKEKLDGIERDILCTQERLIKSTPENFRSVNTQSTLQRFFGRFSE